MNIGTNPVFLQKKVLFTIIFISFFLMFSLGSNVIVFSYDEELETIHWTPPNVEAAEYIYALQNDLDSSLAYLNTAEKQAKQLDEPDIITQIRMYHINMLRLFAYSSHESSLKKSEIKHHIKELAFHNMEEFTKITKQRPQYAEIYRMMSISSFIFGNNSMEGMSYILTRNEELQSYMSKCIELNEKSPTCRVAYTNFHSMAPRFVGADREAGMEAILMTVDSSWPKIYEHEYRISRMINAKSRKDKELMEKEIAILESMYPNSWRLPYVIKKY